MPIVHINQFELNDGISISFPENGVNLLVGPNNSGKSQFLRDIMGLAGQKPYSGTVIRDADFSKDKGQDIEKWFKENHPSTIKDGIESFAINDWHHINGTQVSIYWRQEKLSQLSPAFIFHADGTSRLTAGDSQPSIDFETEPATHPV